MKLRSLIAAVVSSLGISYLINLEGERLTAYRDGAGVPTICVGHTKDVYIGQVATRAQCEQFLRDDLKSAQAAVRRGVRVPLTQNQFDALAIFAFNVGNTAFLNSTLLRKLNQGDTIGAINEFPKWNKIRDPHTNRLVVSKGLSNRRQAELTLFLKDYL